MGDEADYAQDMLTRYQRGEMFSQDSIRHTGPEYHTGIGRVVYGGGGITPDIFIPEDTLGMTSYYKKAAMSGLILQFAFTYTDDNRLKLNNFKEMQQLADYLEKQNMVEKFVSYADRNGLQRRNLMIRKSYHLLDQYITSRIIYNMLDEEAWNEYLNLGDPAISAAKKLFETRTAWPEKALRKTTTKATKRTACIAPKSYDYAPIHVRYTTLAHA